MGNYLDTAMLTMNQQLNRELVKGIRSNGKINTMTLARIYPMQQYLIIRSKCEGELAVKVEKVEFSL
jgi:hypothetical protein